MPGLSGSKAASNPGDCSACSLAAATGSKCGSAITASGGNVRTRKRVSPGDGIKPVTNGVGSTPLKGTTGTGGVHQTKLEPKPGVCSNSLLQGGAPSIAMIDFPSPLCAVTTRRIFIGFPLRCHRGQHTSQPDGTIAEACVEP